MKIKFERMLAVLEDARWMSIREEITRDALREMQAAEQTIAALQEQVQKLAAENSDLKNWAEVRAKSDDALEQENYSTLKIDWRQRSLADIETPATDAFIREIGAKAVDAFGIYHNFSDNQLVQVEAKKYAAKLRAGEQP